MAKKSCKNIKDPAKRKKCKAKARRKVSGPNPKPPIVTDPQPSED